jgi:NTE family protein
MPIDTAVVIAGAVARGAYEAGALAEVLTQKLTQQDLPNTIFLGTSAGAINAVLWAGFADGQRSVAQIGALVCDVWRGIHDTDVFAPVRSAAQSIWGLASGHPSSFLNTEPLARTVADRFKQLQISKNVAQGTVGGVGVAATLCGDTTAGARTDLFYQARTKPDKGGSAAALDYFAAQLAPQHVLASSAVPVLFAPIAIDGAYYIDGGVRLNTPIAPAIHFGAKRIIVVSSHSTEYPPRRPAKRVPSPADATAMVLHSVLADGTIEDLRRVHRVNTLIADRPEGDTPYRTIEFIVVSPPAGQLATYARRVIDRSYALKGLLNPLALAKAARYAALEKGLIGRFGTGAGVDELLSYVLFDPDYFELQIAQGSADARQAGDFRT